MRTEGRGYVGLKRYNGASGEQLWYLWRSSRFVVLTHFDSAVYGSNSLKTKVDYQDGHLRILGCLQFLLEYPQASGNCLPLQFVLNSDNPSPLDRAFHMVGVEQEEKYGLPTSHCVLLWATPPFSRDMHGAPYYSCMLRQCRMMNVGR